MTIRMMVYTYHKIYAMHYCNDTASKNTCNMYSDPYLDSVQ